MKVIAIGRLLLLVFVAVCESHADQLIYSNSLQNGWQNWSWATVNLANTSPVHSSPNSISVTANNSPSDWQALYLSIPAMDASPFTNLTFWINGGAAGGQAVVVQGSLSDAPQPGIEIGPLPTNAWKQINLSMTALGVANQPNFTGFWLLAEGNSPVPTFYVDDIVLQSGPAAPITNPVLRVDVLADRHAINPWIYGVAFASGSNQLSDLNVPLHRSGGNATTRYNWQLNASSRASDWYFESLPSPSSTAGADGDDFIRDSKNGGAQPMLTIPIIGWVAKLGAGRSGLASYATNKYGLQTGADPYWPLAGNGVLPGGIEITNNDPTDANLVAGTNFQAGWVQHLTNRWNTATNGGLRFYLMDNEWSLWHSTHRDVHPIGPTMDEVRDKFSDHAKMVKGIDPNALVAGPEEWGWSGFFYSGYDQQYGSQHGWGFLPDRAAHTNQDFAPWFLAQMQQRSQAAGKRLIDVFTLHYYPQGGEALSTNVTTSMQLRRNRSTRSLWDTNYTDESWIADKVMLIPRMKRWVATNYPGTLTGITEYNWGADEHMNGATAQADILGIFGREGLDLGTRWTCPDAGTPVYNAFKMYRNYDGNRSVFGQTGVRAAVPNPDALAAFAAVRTNDGALTVMVINKDPVAAATFVLSVTNFAALGTAQRWQLSSNLITHPSDLPFTNNLFSNTVPAQSITLFVLPTLPPFHLRPGTNHVAGQFTFWLDGTNGQTYTVQSSTDLVHWVSFNTNTFASNSVPFTLSVTGRANQFYRGASGQ